MLAYAWPSAASRGPRASRLDMCQHPGMHSCTMHACPVGSQPALRACDPAARYHVHADHALRDARDGALRRGRKKAALTYVITYTLGCLTKHWNMFGVLLVGRLFCGVATSLLYSAFESWLVAEHFKVPPCHTHPCCPAHVPHHRPYMSLSTSSCSCAPPPPLHSSPRSPHHPTSKKQSDGSQR